MAEEIGKVTHYFTNIGVAVIELSAHVKVGDRIRFSGAHDDFEQVIDSMEIERKPVEEAKAGDSIGLKVLERVHQHTVVSRVD